ncbi:MAG: efflux RND transporter permease subunit [Bacteroidales bacterium]|nr:efflux RND transporter permease subunit [Bacteroidales bacterium]
MVKFLINRPIAVTISLIAFLVLGLITARLLPVSLLPDVDIPEITVQISYPGMSAGELENVIVGRMRGQLQQINKLEEMESTARDGSALIRLRFAYGTETDYSFMEVNEQIDGAMAMMPRDMERPRVIRASATDIPVFNLSVIYREEKRNNMLQLSEFCESVIKRRIEQLPEVAMADISGMQKPQITIVPDMQKLEQTGISLQELEQAIKNNNINLGNILIRDGYYQYNVNFNRDLRSVDDIEQVLLKAGERIVSLGELARVELQPAQAKGMYLYNNREAIVMSVIKQSDARVHDMREKLDAMLDDFGKQYPELEFQISQDQTQILNVSIDNLKQNLVWGALLAFLIMFIVLGDWRSPLLMGISIPASIIVSMLVFYLLGLTINIVSLSGLILGAGMMIDNSIIVIDNISQYRSRGLALQDAVIKGTNEVIRPLISSVLTTCAVFVPLVFLSNIAGALFYDQAIAIAAGLGVSLLVSILILPVLYDLMNRNEREGFKLKIPGFNVLDLYERGMERVFRNKALYFILFLAFIPAGYYLFQRVGKSNMPEVSRSDYVIHIDWNEKNTLEESARRVKELIVDFDQQISQANAFLGEQQFLLQRDHQNSSSELDLIITADVDNLDEVQNLMKSYLKEHYPHAKIEFNHTKNVFEALFDTDESDLTVMLSNKTTEGVPSPAYMDVILASAGKELLLDDSQKPPLKEVIRLSLIQERIYLYNLEPSTVIARLKTAFNASEIDKIAFNQRMVPLIMGDQVSDLTKLLDQTFISNKKGEDIPLKWLVELKHEMAYKNITAGKQGEFIPLNIEMGSHDGEQFISNVKSFFTKYSDLSISLKGSFIKNKEMLREMVFVMSISLLLLFFILSAQFESVVQPLIVLTEVFIDVSGALFLLYVFGGTLNIMSAIGIIVMTGIIINDSILKVDTINQLRRQGLPLKEAIFEAGKRRFNPIIMTSLTTILALTPLFFTSGLGVELQLPLALAVIGGLGLGTFVSLFFIPLFYGIIYQTKN